MSAAPRRVLLVAYYFPPLNIVGARRPFALARHLVLGGHDVSVLTTPRNGVPVGPDGARVRTARDLLATRLNWRAEALDAVTGRSDATWDAAMTRWGDVFVPDVQLLSWVPFAAATALRGERPDVVITTSPTNSTHLVGLALARRGVPWIADLRDGWGFEAPRPPFPLPAQRWFDRALERSVVRGADAVVTVSEPLSEDLRRRYGVRVETIANGFDPDDGRVDELPVELAPARERLTLVHTGGLGRERTLAPLFAALTRLAEADPSVRERVEVIVAGAQTAAERDGYADPRLQGMVRPVGFLERPRALALQRAADVLLLVTTGRLRGEATGKLFEYLAAARPVLVLGDDSEAARIVATQGAGWAIPTRDADAAEVVLRLP